MLPDDSDVVQPNELVIPVIVALVEPAVVSNDERIVNVPVEVPMVRVAVLPEDTFAPERLNVTV